MKKLCFSIAALVAILAWPVSSARADFLPNCNNSHTLIPDGRVTQGVMPGGSTFLGFKFSTQAGATYSIEAHAPERSGATNQTVEVLRFIDINPNDCTGTSSLTARNGSGISPVISGNASRILVAGTGELFIVRTLNAAGLVLTMRISDTTQFHPGWSTGGGFNTFYSIQNTTNASCSVTLTLFNLAGAQVATTTQSIDAESLLATNTQALGVGAGLAGSGRLTHDCPPGGILVDAAIANFGTSPAAIIPAKFEAVRQAQ